MAAAISPQPLVVGEVNQIANNTTTTNKPKSYADQVSSKQDTTIDLVPVMSIHGEPTIQFSMEEVNQFTREEGLHQAVVMKFSYGKPDLQELKKIFSTQFDVQGCCNIGLLEFRHILVRFDIFNDYVKFLSRSTGYIKARGEDFFFRNFPWTIGFNPKEETSMAVIWISLPGLPPNFFAKRSLMSIASACGKPLAVDKATQDRTRPSAARVKVLLNLLDKHPKRVRLEIIDRTTGKSCEFFQEVTYDNLPKYCSLCKHQGHEERSCRLMRDKEQDSKKIEQGRGAVIDEIQVGQLANIEQLKGDARDYLNARRNGQLGAELEKQKLLEHEQPTQNGERNQMGKQQNDKVNYYVAMGNTVGDVLVFDKGPHTIMENTTATSPKVFKDHIPAQEIDPLGEVVKDNATRIENSVKSSQMEQCYLLTKPQNAVGKGNKSHDEKVDFSMQKTNVGKVYQMEAKDEMFVGQHGELKMQHAAKANANAIKATLGQNNDKKVGHGEISALNISDINTYVIDGKKIQKSNLVGQIGQQKQEAHAKNSTLHNSDSTNVLAGKENEFHAQILDEIVDFSTTKYGSNSQMKKEKKEAGHLGRMMEKQAVNGIEKQQAHALHVTVGPLEQFGDKDAGNFCQINDVINIEETVQAQSLHQRIVSSNTKKKGHVTYALQREKATDDRVVTGNSHDYLVDCSTKKSKDVKGNKTHGEQSTAIDVDKERQNGGDRGAIVTIQAHSSNAPTLHFSNPNVERIIKDAQHEMMMKESIVKQPLAALNTSVYEVPSNSVESYGDYGGESGQLMLSTGNNNEMHEGEHESVMEDIESTEEEWEDEYDDKADFGVNLMEQFNCANLKREQENRLKQRFQFASHRVERVIKDEIQISFFENSMTGKLKNKLEAPDFIPNMLPCRTCLHFIDTPPNTVEDHIGTSQAGAIWMKIATMSDKKPIVRRPPMRAAKQKQAVPTASRRSYRSRKN